MTILAAVLGFLCLASALVGHSRILLLAGAVLIGTAETLRRLHASADEVYQKTFRERLTREWFHSVVLQGYLAQPTPQDELASEIKKEVREACLRVTGQNADRTSIEERLFFEPDSLQNTIYILREDSRWSSREVSRAIVWRRSISIESSKVAIVWPPSPGSIGRAPDVRFFDNGKPALAVEPLRTKLIALYDFLMSVSSNRSARVAISSAGIWAGLKLNRRPLAAPVTQSCLDPRSYEAWMNDLALLDNREIIRGLHSI